MKPPKVEQVMQGPVYTVGSDEMVQAALDTMNEHGTKKILVLEAGKPKGVLEAWMVTESDRQRRVREMDLRPFGRVKVGTDLSKVMGEIKQFSAVYVVNPDDPNTPVGVVTAYDLVRAL